MNTQEARDAMQKMVDEINQLSEIITQAEAIPDWVGPREIIKEKETGRWKIQAKCERSSEREQILSVLRASDKPQSPAEINASLNKKPSSLRQLLLKMKRSGEVTHTKNGYITSL